MGRFCRKNRCFVILFSLCLSLYVILYSFEGQQNSEFRESFLSYLKNHSTKNYCDLPLKHSPNDASILPYMKNLPKYIQCNKQNIAEITVIDEENNVLRQTDSTASCLYRTIERTPENDDDYVLSDKMSLDSQNGLELDKLENYIHVECKLNNGQTYENVHSWFNPPSIDENKQNKGQGKEIQTRLSVLVMVVESLSRLNYLRYMPKTRAYLEKQIGNVHYLEGLNKIEDNSYPNMIAFLSGKRAYSGEILNDEVGPFDNNSMIWKAFSKAGYWTAFIEDMPKFTLFNYISKGFINQPTTFYPRPMWLYIDQKHTNFIDRLLPFTRDRCFNDRYPTLNILFDQTYSFVKQSSKSGRPFFAFSFAIEITHNDFNRAQTIDNHLRDLFVRLKPHLKNTIVILMGDHGNRFGDVLLTNIGRIESRMPLFAVSIPEQLRIRVPKLESYLEANKQRLVTWTDLHLMLLDVADDNFIYKSNQSLQNSKITKTYSPWRENVSLFRSCLDAQIPDFFCVCDSRAIVPTNTDFVIEAAQVLIIVINRSLQSFTDCLPLKLRNITSAELIFMPSEIESSRRKGTRYEQRIEITIIVSPSNGIFRGQLKKTFKEASWSSKLEDISRLNAYGSQSTCVNDRRVRPFCYCHNQM